MGKKKIYSDKDNWRNSKEPYTIDLMRGNYILNDKALRPHIDYQTYNFKPWPDIKLKVVSRTGNSIEMLNVSGNAKYDLKIVAEENEIHVSCSCDRRIKYLCHHAFHALLHIIKEHGIVFFQQRK